MADMRTTHPDDPSGGQRRQVQPVVDFEFEDDTIVISYRFVDRADFGDTMAAGQGSGGGPDPVADEVGISGAGFFSKSGKPLVPSFGRFVQLPPDTDFTITWETQKLRVIEAYWIKPAQENATDQEENTFEFDADAYQHDGFYPGDILDWSGPHYLDAYRAICLHVRPMQYNPKRKLLHFYQRIRVFIKLQPRSLQDQPDHTGKEPDRSVFRYPAQSLEGFGNFLFNPTRKYFDKVGFTSPRGQILETPPGDHEFVIIYGKDLSEPAKKLKAWKKRRGLETVAVPIGDIVGSAAGDRDKTAQIKAYLRGKRQVPGTPFRYVLLFGDVIEIPTESVNAIQTDHYYYTHRDAHDGECLLPWISGGRIPVGKKEDGMAVVDQIINYEKAPPRNPDYFRRMTLAAYFEDRDREGRQDGKADMAYIHTTERIREHMVARGFVVNRVYVSNTRNPRYYSDGSPVPAAVKGAMIYKSHGRIATKRLISQINEGQLLVSHRDHGQKWGWSQPPFRTADLKSLSNAYPSVFFSINCLTGSFQRQQKTFADEILKSSGTAPSLIAATANSGSWRNDSMVKALFDAIWPGIIKRYPPAASSPVKYHRVGDLLNYAKAYLLVSHDFNEKTKKQFEIYHVIGDPTLELWGGAPAALELHTRILKDTLLINMNTCPGDAVLSVWYGDTRLMRKKPSIGRLAIPLSLFEDLPDDALDPQRDKPYAIDVSLYAPGHRFAETTLWF